MPRRAALVLAAVTVLVVVLAVPAAAKGPTGATITGPGIDDPIVIEGFGERGAGGNFSALVEAAGFWVLIGGVEALGPGEVLDGPPSGDLGPMYLVAWHLGDDTAEAEVYLEASGGPVVHVVPDNIVEFGISAPGGWFAASSSLPDLLARYGVPVQEDVKAAFLTTTVAPAPAADILGSGTVPIAAAAGLVAILVVTVLWAVGRRPRRTEAP
jgi:hypothetical protein